MKYYSIDNVILVAYCKDLNYISTQKPGIGNLSGGAADKNPLLVKLTENCNEIDRKSFEEFISKPKNSSEAKEMVAYYLTLENDES